MPDTATLRTLLDAATPGPWEVIRYRHGGGRIFVGRKLIADTYHEADRDLIGTLPDWLPALLDVAEAARDAVAQAEHSTSGALWHYEVEALRVALDRLDR